MWEEYAKDPSNALEWQQCYMNFIFDLEDTSGELNPTLKVGSPRVYNADTDPFPRVSLYILDPYD